MKKIFVFFILFFSLMVNVYAYSKEDIINLGNSVSSCDKETNIMINDARNSYNRLLKERDITQKNLNKIYNNLRIVISIIDEYEVCSEEEVKSLSDNIKNRLKNLFYETRDIMTSSPKIGTGDNDKPSVVVDPKNKEINIYEGNKLKSVIKANEKLNYVGLNKLVIVLIFSSLLLLGLCVFFRVKTKKYIFNSLIYVFCFIFMISVMHCDKLSNLFNLINTFSISESDSSSEIIVKDNNIISYPSVGEKYAKLYIGKDSEDVYFGDSSKILSLGIGTRSGSGLPGEKNIVMSGHNTKLFNKLFNIKSKDKITIETVYGNFIYEVKDTKIVKDTDINILNSKYDLVLYTCYPNKNIYGNKRLVVFLNNTSSEWVN